MCFFSVYRVPLDVFHFLLIACRFEYTIIERSIIQLTSRVNHFSSETLLLQTEILTNEVNEIISQTKS